MAKIIANALVEIENIKDDVEKMFSIKVELIDSNQYTYLCSCSVADFKKAEKYHKELKIGRNTFQDQILYNIYHSIFRIIVYDPSNKLIL